MIKHKLIEIFGTIVLVMMMFGCPNEQSINQVGVAENTGSQTAYLTIGINEGSRMALPTVLDQNIFDSINLKGVSNDSTAITVDMTWDGDTTANKTAFEQMKEAKIAVTANAGYTFTLTATKDGASWSDTQSLTISASTDNYLHFTLLFDAFDETASGSGSITITLLVPSVVKSVETELKNIKMNQVWDTSSDENVYLHLYRSTYTASDIPVGNYLLTFTLYGDNEKKLKLGTWREYIVVANGLLSESSIYSIYTTADLDSIYTITLDPNDGEFVGSTTFSGSYTRHSDVALPTAADISRTGYTFDGWSVINGSEVSDATIDGWAKNTRTGDVTLQAKWVPLSFSIGLSDDGLIVKDYIDVTYDNMVPNVGIPTKQYYRFGGYYDSSSDPQVQYINAEGNGCHIWDQTNDLSVALYAKWIP
ncbi:MAG: InlB B-repeat-containing protein, partial [Spirochaetales bacterium]|nr:InlB B-repeat-containing protein [Spirochaetales bacterium]